MHDADTMIRSMRLFVGSFDSTFFAIVIASMGTWAVSMRGMMVNIQGEDYMNFAEAKGLKPRRVFLHYGVRNAILPQLTAVRALDVDPQARTLRAEREIDGGVEIVEASLPVLVTAAEDLAPERFASKAERAAAESKPIETLAASDLGIEAERIGAAGSPTWVLGLSEVRVERRGELRPYVLERPVRLDVTFKHYRPGEMLSYLSVVERTSSHSIRFTGRDIVEVSRFLEFLGDYSAELTP